MTGREVLEKQAIYIPLQKAADCEGLKYNSFIQRVQRNSEKYDIISELSSTGGKDRSLVSVYSLSPEGQKNYWQQFRLPEDKPSKVNVPKLTADRLAELQAFLGKEQYQKLFNKAVLDARPIEEYLSYVNSGIDMRKKDLITPILDKYSISKVTFYRKLDSYKTGGYAALIRLPKRFLTRRYIDRTSIMDDVKKVLRAEYFQLSQPTPTDVYRKVQKYCRLMGVKEPCKASVLRYIKDINLTEPDMVCLGREGIEAYNKKFLEKATRNDPAYVNQVWEGDHHRCDFFVMYDGKPYRPWMTIWMDVCTRIITGFTLALHANGRTIALSLRHGILKKKLSEFSIQASREIVIRAIANLGTLPEELAELSEKELPVYGLPRELYIDNGEDYKAKLKKGLKHEGWDYEPEVRNTCQLLDIRVQFCTPYSPWAKGHAERWFRTYSGKFAKFMPGFCGSDNKKRPAGLDENDLAAKGKLLTLEEAYILTEFFINEYHNTVHSSLGMTPFEKLEKTPRIRTEMPDERTLDCCLMDSDTASVTASGFRKFGLAGNPVWYKHPLLAGYAKKKIIVRYDPNHIGEIYCFDPEKGGAYICTATNRYYLDQGASKDDIQDLAKRRASSRKEKVQRLKGEKHNSLSSIIQERTEAGKKVVAGQMEEVKSSMPMVTGLGNVPKKIQADQASAGALPKAANSDYWDQFWDNYLIKKGKKFSKK